jgi:hypothetical protein
MNAQRQSQRLLAVAIACGVVGAALIWEAFSTASWAAGLVALGVGVLAIIIAWYAWKSR